MIRLLFLCCFVIFFSCREKYPKGILPPEKMQAIYYDMMKADELSIIYRVSDSSFMKEKKHEAYYLTVLRTHNISKEDFTRSQEYYEAHPELLKVVFDSLHKDLERIQNMPDTTLKQIPADVADTLSRRPIITSDSFRKRKRLVLVDSL
jgi:hypothetical protein